MSGQCKKNRAVFLLTSKVVSWLSPHLRIVNSVFLLISNLVIWFVSQSRCVKEVKCSMPVRSVIFRFLQINGPEKLFASVIYIAVSLLVFIVESLSKKLLKLTSGMNAFWLIEIKGVRVSMMSSFFII